MDYCPEPILLEGGIVHFIKRDEDPDNLCSVPFGISYNLLSYKVLRTSSIVVFQLFSFGWFVIVGISCNISVPSHTDCTRCSQSHSSFVE